MSGPLIHAVAGHAPRVDLSAFVAPGVALLGDVELGPDASVWYGSVLRADAERIRVGAGTNVQDLCVVHADPGLPALLGERVTLGHGAVVHGAVIDDDVLVGMRAVVLNGARVGAFSIVAAGAVVLEGQEVPPGSLVAGVPGKVRRELTADERAMIQRTARTYVERSALHRDALGR